MYEYGLTLQCLYNMSEMLGQIVRISSLVWMYPASRRFSYTQTNVRIRIRLCLTLVCTFGASENERTFGTQGTPECRNKETKFIFTFTFLCDYFLSKSVHVPTVFLSGLLLSCHSKHFHIVSSGTSYGCLQVRFEPFHCQRQTRLKVKSNPDSWPIRQNLEVWSFSRTLSTVLVDGALFYY